VLEADVAMTTPNAWGDKPLAKRPQGHAAWQLVKPCAQGGGTRGRPVEEGGRG
jgi:hypothetical protein